MSCPKFLSVEPRREENAGCRGTCIKGDTPGLLGGDTGQSYRVENELAGESSPGLSKHPFHSNPFPPSSSLSNIMSLLISFHQKSGSEVKKHLDTTGLG